MMKLFGFLMLGLASPAFALQVGDSATYQMTNSSGTYQVTRTVTQINGDTFTIQSTGFGPTAETSGSIRELVEMTTLSNCPRIPGTLETLTTPAGTFQTCHFNFESELYLSPDVPLGVVKSVSSSETMVLQSFVRH